MVVQGATMNFTIRRLDHIQLTAPIGAEETARRFYAGILGLREIEKPESLKPNGGLWFEIADIQLHIGVEENQSHSKRHPAFEVDNLVVAREYLLANSIQPKEETPIPGVERFSFLDPFGNRIELLEKKYCE
jgi:catechol 2,3-dioxygenase-like lactoylglutathione lyase family enzyme